MLSTFRYWDSLYIEILIRLVYLVVNVLILALESFIFERGNNEINAARENLLRVTIEVACFR